MAFALLIIGIVMIVAAVRDTVTELIVLLANDFTGKNNFLYWVLALLIIGAIGYVPKLKGVSDAFLVLVILALFLNVGNPSTPAGGFFKQFVNAISSTQGATASTALSYTAGGNNPISINLPGGGAISL